MPQAGPATAAVHRPTHRGHTHPFPPPCLHVVHIVGEGGVVLCVPGCGAGHVLVGPSLRLGLIIHQIKAADLFGGEEGKGNAWERGLAIQGGDLVSSTRRAGGTFGTVRIASLSSCTSALTPFRKRCSCGCDSGSLVTSNSGSKMFTSSCGVRDGDAWKEGRSTAQAWCSRSFCLWICAQTCPGAWCEYTQRRRSDTAAEYGTQAATSNPHYSRSPLQSCR